MLAHLPSDASKTDHLLLLKRYGFGVPDFGRAIRSARNALALIEQSTIQPYTKRPGRQPSLAEMKLFHLPWPADALNGLGAADVEMRVTLSYFIGPNPAESARGRKSRYASHRLRFAVKTADEDVDEFRRRINKAARTEGEVVSHVNDTGFWMFKEYFNLNLKQTFGTWTIMESTISVLGLLGVLILNIFIH